MTKLENRVARIEKATAHVDLGSMTDEGAV